MQVSSSWIDDGVEGLNDIEVSLNQCIVGSRCRSIWNQVEPIIVVSDRNTQIDLLKSRRLDKARLGTQITVRISGEGEMMIEVRLIGSDRIGL